MAKFCTNCGKELNENQAVCLNCGTEVKDAKKDDFQVWIFVLLIIFFWPAALIYYVVKKG